MRTESVEDNTLFTSGWQASMAFNTLLQCQGVPSYNICSLKVGRHSRLRNRRNNIHRKENISKVWTKHNITNKT